MKRLLKFILLLIFLGPIILLLSVAPAQYLDEKSIISDDIGAVWLLCSFALSIYIPFRLSKIKGEKQEEKKPTQSVDGDDPRTEHRKHEMKVNRSDLKGTKINLLPGATAWILDSTTENEINPTSRSVRLRFEEHQVGKKLFSDEIEPHIKLGRSFLGYHWGFFCRSCGSLHLVMDNCPSCANNSAHFAKCRGGGFAAFCDSCDSCVVASSWTCSACKSSNPVNPVFEIDGIPEFR